MDQDPMLWSRRPLPLDLLQYAAEDVLQLLLLQDKLKANLGKTEMELVSTLSTGTQNGIGRPTTRTSTQSWQFSIQLWQFGIQVGFLADPAL